MSRLRGLPGVLLLRSLLVAILVLILVAAFLDRTADLSRQVQETARRQLIAQFNASLSLRLLEAISRGRLADLAAMDRANPFEVLLRKDGSVPPAEYRGEWAGPGLPSKPGWYFDPRRRDIAWFDGRDWLPQRWQLRLDYEDRNDNGRFDPRVDKLHALGMKKAAG